MLISIIIVVLCLVLTAVFSGGGEISFFALLFDPVSLLLLIVTVIPLLLCNGLWKDFCLSFKIAGKKGDYSMAQMKNSLEAVDFTRRSLLWSSLVITAFSSIIILRHCDQLEKLGPSLAIILLVLLYTAIFELCLLPLHVRIKKKLINYMEEE